MNTKKLIARCMLVLTFAGTILKIPLRIQAGISQQIHSSGEHMPLSNMQTDFYCVETIADNSGRLLKSSIKSSKTAAYSLSDSEWADCGSDYYFSLLNTKEKSLYLNLKQAADAYLTGTDDFQMTKVTRETGEVQTYILPVVSYQGMSVEQMKKVFSCFLYENPQYYFMRNSVIYSEKSETMTIGLYEAFADGNERAAYTADFADQLAVWETMIAAGQTTVEKEQIIHQIVCDYVAYNDNAQDDDPDDRSMSQSCISAVLFERTTVCMGYAQLFSLLCNRAGIECVTVTSAGHAWNKVRMGGIWYNVDCTWNDSRGDQMFLNVTDEELQAEDTKAAEHTPSPEWEGLAPSCTVPFDMQMADGEDIAGNISVPEKTVVLTLKNQEKGSVSVEFDLIEGCDGYVIQYALNAAMETGKKKEIQTAPYVLDELKSGKVYYVRVRGYVLDSKGNKLYGTFSKKQKITVK